MRYTTSWQTLWLFAVSNALTEEHLPLLVCEMSSPYPTPILFRLNMFNFEPIINIIWSAAILVILISGVVTYIKIAEKKRTKQEQANYRETLRDINRKNR